MYTSGALVFCMSVARITVIRLKETPKYLLGEGNDEKLVEDFHAMAAKYNRPCSITVEMLDACGVVQSAHGKSRFSVGEVLVHFRGLFATRTIGFSTVLIWASWTLIGLAYPLFYVFLNTYLASRGAHFGDISTYDTWRNYALVNISGIPVSVEMFCSRISELVGANNYLGPDDSWVHVQLEISWPQIYHGDWGFDHHGFLLCLYSSTN